MMAFVRAFDFPQIQVVVAVHQQKLSDLDILLVKIVRLATVCLPSS